MPQIGVQLYRDTHSTFLRETPSWQLSIEREATETDLENNHYLEEIGDTLWMTSLEVTHCPYCGEKLPEPNLTQPADFGRFAHLDYSGWSGHKV